MDAWLPLVRLGDPGIIFPAAAGMAAWLLASRAWRTAFWWSLLFAAAVALVAANKIAFMGWGNGWPALCFKALSGHATGAAAVFPLLLYLLLQRASPALRTAGVATGLALAALVAAALVASDEHSLAEVSAGWCTGAIASLGAMQLAGTQAPLRAPGGVLAFALVFVAGAWLMQWAHLGWWMIKAARLLSGNAQIFNLHVD